MFQEMATTIMGSKWPIRSWRVRTGPETADLPESHSATSRSELSVSCR